MENLASAVSMPMWRQLSKCKAPTCFSSQVTIVDIRALLTTQIHAKRFLDAAYIRMLNACLLSELVPLRDRAHDFLNSLVRPVGFQPHARSKNHEVAMSEIVSLSG